jgi:hypothetical protein
LFTAIFTAYPKPKTSWYQIVLRMPSTTVVAPRLDAKANTPKLAAVPEIVGPKAARTYIDHQR